MVFIAQEAQAELYMKHMGEESTIAMAKRLTKKEREALFVRLQSGDANKCLASKIYAQGVTFSDLRALVNAEGGGDNTSAIQKPGRLAEIRPGKKCGVIVDYMFDCDDVPTENLSELNRNGDEHWVQMIRDSRARRDAYERKGYTIKDVDTVNEIKEIIENYAL
jgi:superfamily II DNA or RNA helicase